jgi:hypothetical protein
MTEDSSTKKSLMHYAVILTIITAFVFVALYGGAA